MGPIEPHVPVPAALALDQEAARKAIQDARLLYVSAYRPAEVAAVTASLREHLRLAIPACGRIAARMPADDRARAQLLASLQTARQLLIDGAGEGPMSALVHMQLLADSTGVLAARLRSACDEAAR